MPDNGESGKSLPDMPPDVLTALTGAHDEAMRALAASQAEVVRLRAAAKRVLEADMRGVRDLDALNALEDAAGFTQQGQRRAR